MSRTSTQNGRQHLLERKNPRSGFRETLIYEGSLRCKPRGWTLVRSL